ncbi:MAG TPA: serine/threonine-protein kinase [Rhodoferax sp.]|jgi:serine/threonine-protein kinase|nr:serine/threonine-protein kinase [Rhodoferax sp.]HPW29370.1 serine/threonine-protein kinase [Rhodoferax sp.]
MTAFSRLGKYTIRRELGKGAMGVVYEGFDPLIERTVAIKTILPTQLNGDEAANVLARFKREAQAAGRLNHPGIVAVYDYGEEIADDDHTMVAGEQALARQRVAYIAMEFVKGRELRDFFEANERFALKDVERLMGEILDALAHAHAHGVVHRDIKPANLIVLADGKVKIADFGIARVEKSELTQVGTVMGTPAYMSPEQFMGQPVDGRSDIFSCGVILYQFLTGEKPFTGNSTTIMFKVLHEEPLAPSLLNVALPAAFDLVVKKAMAKNPDERYQSAQEFAQAIKTTLSAPAPVAAGAATDPDRTELSMPPVAPVVPKVTPAPARAAEPTPAVPQGGQPKARSSATLVAAALAGIAVVGAGSFVFLRNSNAPTTVAQVQAPEASPAAVSAPSATVAVATQEPALEPGTMVISALGLVDPADARFNGDASAAQAESRADAMRQLVEKAVALYVQKDSLNKNYAVLDRKLLSQPGAFIKTVIKESASATGKDGLLETEARAVVKVRDVQKSLNQLSKEERVDFIRNNGDPKVSILMAIRNADTTQALPAERSMVAENVLKERIKSFGFRVWSADGELPAGAKAQPSDFQIEGEVKIKLLSARLPASGLTITKTALTSWTIKAIDKASGEEVYLNTVNPSGKSWATEDQALAEIGKLVGDEFSKNFFLDHFNYGAQNVRLNIAGLPDDQSASQLLRELRGFRQVLDAQLVGGSGAYQLQLADGNASDLILDGILKPLNAKLGQNCFALAGSNGAQVNVSFSTACADIAVRGKLANLPPAGLQSAPGARGKLQGKPVKTST